ncbi:hypothetical protein [Flavobacterium microcysteis]|uniref:Uncharacterized protein n=1 Tax=Flavobacterium microcysteis TaxID=2596891 RepID=A0A501Q297_9FLAO|nr:hypothetical protein [Flavobacterium microcysteis]TPD67000.1 hypothetical protein FJA49_12015 [Flavobacterium microcysteis]
MLKRLSEKLSKVDYWKKWELFELFDDLHRGEKLLIEIASKNSESQFLKFKDNYIEELYEIEGDNVADFTRIWEWFTPTKEWETLLSEKGKEIGDNVFRITDQWKRSQDFLIGTKVSLENERGVVLGKSKDRNEYGLIRWDTEKENDIEDWRGLFESFLQAGGQIINQDHEFKFINNDGTEKKVNR